MMKSKRKRGFTIVELIVVMAIIAILVLIAVPAFTKYIQDADDTKYITEGTEIYTAIIEGMEELVVKGEDAYDVDKLLPLVNENMGAKALSKSSDESNTLVINKGTDALLDDGYNETWGLVIDKDSETIIHNNQVDSDHNYVFVNGIYVENYVPPIDDGGDSGDDGGDSGDDGGDSGDDGGDGGDDGGDGGDDGGDGGDDGGDGGDDGGDGGDDGGDGGGTEDPTSGNDDMDTGALDVYQAVVEARQIIKDSGRDCYQPFQITEITNQITNSHLLDQSIRISSGYDTDSGDNTWGLTVEETGNQQEYDLGDDKITLTNCASDGYTYTYVNGIFIKKE